MIAEYIKTQGSKRISFIATLKLSADLVRENSGVYVFGAFVHPLTSWWGLVEETDSGNKQQNLTFQSTIMI